MKHIIEISALTVAKVDILKIKADHYTWNALLSEEDKKNLLFTLVDINNLLDKLYVEDK